MLTYDVNKDFDLRYNPNPVAWRKNSSPSALGRNATYLVVQHQEDSAAHIHIARPFHLEPISLLGCRCPVPLVGGKEYKKGKQGKK